MAFQGEREIPSFTDKIAQKHDPAERAAIIRAVFEEVKPAIVRTPLDSRERIPAPTDRIGLTPRSR